MPEALLELRGLQAQFAMARRLRDRFRREPAEYLRAVDGVDLTIERGQTVGLVGESGCGKTTLARCVVGLVEPTAGSMRFEGKPLGHRKGAAARQIQMVFQDPYGSLNPRMTVRKALSELLIVHDMVPKSKREERLRELMALVDLPAGTLEAYPRQLSGGQRQRVCIARALALEPELIVADEAVSALDVSVQATILNLLQGLTTRLGLTTLFIAHDLSVVRRLCDEVAVMYLGRIVERGPTDVVFSNPRHPYTRALMAAVPRIGTPSTREDEAVHGDPPSPLHLPTGCRFRTRCPIAEDRCAVEEPDLSGPNEEHEAACYFAWPDEPSGPTSLLQTS